MDLLQLVEDRNPWWRDPAARAALRLPFRRPLQGEVLRRVLRFEDRRATVVVGPRQVGKSTLLRQTADDLLSGGFPPPHLTYFDFSDARLAREVGAWEVAAARPAAVAEDGPRVLLFDEISRSTNWDRWLKQAVDEGGFRIVATDSAASLLRSGTGESGVGRWDELRLEGLSFSEFVAFNSRGDEPADATLARSPNVLERYLALGGFPEHVSSNDPAEMRERIREDVARRAVGDLARFGVDVERVRRLFVYLAQESGSILNLEDRATDLAADRRSVRDWIELLESTALLVSLAQHTGTKASSRLRSRPKLYASDHGVVNAFAASPADAAAVRPKVFETVVFRHLRDAARSSEGEIRYFRRNHAAEIDFVVEVGKRRIGIEVTASREKWRAKLARLARTGGELGADGLILIHGGLARSSGASADPEVRPVTLLDFLVAPHEVLRETEHG